MTATNQIITALPGKLQPGTTAPDFTLSDASGQEVSLASHRGRNVIVYFYPKAATPGCTTEACDFRDSLASLQGSGYDVIGISPDEPAALAEFGKLPPPVWQKALPSVSRLASLCLHTADVMSAIVISALAMSAIVTSHIAHRTSPRRSHAWNHQQKLPARQSRRRHG